MGIPLRSWLLVAASVALPACVAKQRVALDCVPRDVTVYVDGRALERVPEAIELRKDEPHTIYFKGGRYRPQMVIFESQVVDGKYHLSPPDVCTRTVFAELEPEVHMEVDPDASQSPEP